MDIIVKMRVAPGDTKVSKATIKMYNDQGMDVGGQFLLEGETAETNLSIPPGGRCEICEYERPVMYDKEQHATVPMDLTPEDPLTDPNRPEVAPHKGKDKDDEGLKGKDKKPDDTKADFSKTIDSSTKK